MNVAKHPKRRMGRYIRGNVDAVLDIGTLAANSLVAQALGGTVKERTLISSIVAAWSVSDWTLAIGDGPLLVGVAHSDYTAAEIEEYLELAGTWSEADKIAQEVGGRKIRRVGVLTAPNDPNIGAQFALNDGKAIKTKLNWILNAGQTLDIWAYNQGDSVFASTDPDMHVAGHVNLFPK